MGKITFIGPENLEKLEKGISENGFKPNTFLNKTPLPGVFGINLAVGWPLPLPYKKKYERLYEELTSFSPDLYVYPYWQTHITLMTLIDFKRHENPTDEELKCLRDPVPRIIDLIRPVIQDLSVINGPFEIITGLPILSQDAVFLPIINPTDEIRRLRKATHDALRILDLKEIIIPQTIHSTIGRFLNEPKGKRQEFHTRFKAIASNYHFGPATISEVLITSETKPYMIEGEILYKFKLGN
ncbi:MAG: hypothetical protein NT096_10575 [Proteobacteria bacterium]|nr:hypothetical protein [Pseudomonadota bacterium]